MAIDRATGIKLCSLAGLATVAAAGHVLGLGEETVGLLSLAVSLTRESAATLAGHLGIHLLVDAADKAGGRTADAARRHQNHDVHRLIGDAIAHTLEKTIKDSPNSEIGNAYLRVAAVAFRNDWMSFVLDADEAAVGEPAVSQYFSGDPAVINSTPTLTEDRWFGLIQEVAGTVPSTGILSLDADPAATLAVRNAARQLHDHFAFELWEAAKDACQKNSPSWPALLLRLLSEILGHSKEAVAGNAQLAADVRTISTQIQLLTSHLDQRTAAMEREFFTSGDIPFYDAIRSYRDGIYRVAATLDGLSESQNEVTAALAKAQESIAIGNEYAQAAAESSRELLLRFEAFATADRGSLDDDIVRYSKIVKEYFPADYEKDITLAHLRAPSQPKTSLTEVLMRHRHFLIYSNEPARLASLLLALPAFAGARGIFPDKAIPIRLKLGRRAESQTLNDALTVMVGDQMPVSSKFVPFLRERFSAGHAMLILEAPPNGIVSPETMRWIKEEVAVGNGNSSRIAVVVGFGQNPEAVKTLGFPVLIHAFPENGVAALNLTVRIVFGPATRDPVEEIPGDQTVDCRIGQSWSITIRASDDCYVTMFLKGSTGRLYRLFLNSHNSNTFVTAGSVFAVPRSGDNTSFAESGPPGTQTITSFATREPLAVHFAPRVETGYIVPSSDAELAAVVDSFHELPTRDRAGARNEIKVVGKQQ